MANNDQASYYNLTPTTHPPKALFMAEPIAQTWAHGQEYLANFEYQISVEENNLTKAEAIMFARMIEDRYLQLRRTP